ncbi:unnamed protein product [Owenia fusiformis]|uniref:Uncharacterized protein n=1 Tax=Owenia fusiformis TaxID=6347 RepID=A0A8J1TLS7_OWEFU|nr:unnamed protein product [Owenia fusiformis]
MALGLPKFVDQIKPFLHPHFVVNIILSVLFVCLKSTPWICSWLFTSCELEYNEWQVVTFLGCVVVLKNRKMSTPKQYLSSLCMFFKATSIYLFFTNHPPMAFGYMLLCILHLVFLPEPVYSGPEKVTYFRGPHLEDELNSDKRVTWVIEWYAAWSPPCVNFSEIFSKISEKYSLDNLRFGKIDASRYEAVAKRYGVNTAPWSKQLPSCVVYQGGKEKDRVPLIDPVKKKVYRFLFTEENVIRDLGLNELYNQCKLNPLKKRSKHKETEDNDDGDKQKTE